MPTIKEIPASEGGFKQPDEAALQRLLAGCAGMPAETIIRLCRECGLSRTEIATLRYAQIDFSRAEIALEDRVVPLSPEMLSFLSTRWAENAACSDYVLISQRKTAPMAQQSISRLVRSVLDRYGLTETGFFDLHADYVIRQLQSRSIAEVSYITGIDIRSLRAQYCPYAGAGAKSEDGARPSYDELYGLMLREGASVCGLAMWFSWQLDIPAKRLPALTWDMVDFDAAKLGETPLPEPLLTVLSALRAENAQFSDFIFIGKQSKKPLAAERISKIVTTTLIHSGFYGIGLSELKSEFSPDFVSGKQALLNLLQGCGCASCAQIAEALGIDKKAAGTLLLRLRREGSIVRIGTEYYPAGAVVPPEGQQEAIIKYISEHPDCSRSQLCKMLGIIKEPQFIPIVRPLIESGAVIRTRSQRYRLPEAGDFAGKVG